MDEVKNFNWLYYNSHILCTLTLKYRYGHKYQAVGVCHEMGLISNEVIESKAIFSIIQINKIMLFGLFEDNYYEFFAIFKILM